MALVQFFQDPKNGQACEELSKASDEEIVSYITDMEQSIQEKQAGQQGQEQGQPSPAGPPNQGLPQAAPQGPGPGAGAPGQLPPGQIADTPMPMQVASNGQAPRGYMRGGVASLNRGRGY